MADDRDLCKPSGRANQFDFLGVEDWWTELKALRTDMAGRSSRYLEDLEAEIERRRTSPRYDRRTLEPRPVKKRKKRKPKPRPSESVET